MRMIYDLLGHTFGRYGRHLRWLRWFRWFRWLCYLIILFVFLYQIYVYKDPEFTLISSQILRDKVNNN